MNSVREKPQIPSATLMRILEAARLPLGDQDGTERQVGARVLAMRLRHDAVRSQGAPLAEVPATWKNISEEIGKLLKLGDWKTLDVFCESWLKYRADLINHEAEVMDFPGHESPFETVVLTDNSNPAGQSANVVIAGAILGLQRQLHRAPTNKEIVESIQADPYNGIGLRIQKTTVSQFLEKWNLTGRLSTAKSGRSN